MNAGTWMPGLVAGIMAVHLSAAPQELEWNASSDQTLQYAISYFTCSDPKSSTCIALTEADKAKCPECKVWQTHTLGGAEPITLNANAFSGTSSDLTGIKFLKEASKQVYKVDLSVPDGKISAVYGDPAKAGLAVIDPGQSKVGTICLWRDEVGVVVSDPDKSKTSFFNVRVLTLRPGKEGTLVTRSAQALPSAAKPIFVVPQAAFKARSLSP